MIKIITQQEIRTLDLAPTEQAVALALYFRADKEGKCYPSYKRIAIDTKLSERTVIRAVNHLVKKGVLRKKNRYLDLGGQTSNIYYFN